MTLLDRIWLIFWALVALAVIAGAVITAYKQRRAAAVPSDELMNTGRTAESVRGYEWARSAHLRGMSIEQIEWFIDEARVFGTFNDFDRGALVYLEECNQ